MIHNKKDFRKRKLKRFFDKVKQNLLIVVILIAYLLLAFSIDLKIIIALGFMLQKIKIQ